MSEFEIIDHLRTEPLGPDALQRRRSQLRLHDLRAGAPLYRLDAELATAINVALSVGAPLLLTGEPGTGKSQLAYYLTWYFGLEAGVPEAEREQPFTLPVKSTTVWRDLLYTFDTVQYFYDAQRKSRKDEELDPKQYRDKGPLWRAIEVAKSGKTAVVLIDEIDKAPRDFPNDLLRELDQFEIRCKETREELSGHKDRLPIVVITSNSEKRLPPAFLRRCIFHHIEFDETLVRRAVAAWRDFQRDGGPAKGRPEGIGPGEVPSLGPTDEAAVQAFMRVRRVPRLHKLPATAELLVWMAALDTRGVKASELTGSVGELPLLSALIKDRDDLKTLRAT
ncbi:AAA family ATPase [Paraliomyxa miuraensis]|uniref:AAA family ATPase n=1 Tax=Paraliomyxa miuraensis TaxID=376150 RepID=UPI002259302D|nr:MoxR family ATPase [Paraliomyxa miuraensis]MCX4240322.1 MoxR family ATPase [Paraliomyxa miuraensis]